MTRPAAQETARRRRELLGLGAWSLLVGVALVWGQARIAHLPRVYTLAAPLTGDWDWRPGWALVPALALAAALVFLMPRASARLAWPAVVATTAAGTVGWTVALAASDGWAAISEPLGTRHEPLALVPDIESATTFLATFADRVDGYPIHVKGHPPGIPLAYWVLDRLGLPGAGWATAFVLAAAALMVAAVLVVVRNVTDEALARRAAPFLALAPVAVWMTSTDPVYGAALAVGTALIAIASGRSRLLPAVAGGAVLALTLHLTYGAVPLLLIPGVLVLARRAWPTLAAATLGAVAVTAAFLLAGFWWFEGLALTRGFYEEGVASRRPYAYFTFAGNPGALALAVGPATAAGLAVLRDRRAWLLVGAALAAVIAADLSGLSKAEVERIWIPFTPWLLVSAGALVTSCTRATAWLAAQAAVALLLQATLASPW